MISDEDNENLLDDSGVSSAEDLGDEGASEWTEIKSSVPFLFLSLDIPPTPLFKDSQGGLVIPQIPLFEVLNKFDGETWVDQVGSGASGYCRKRYKLKELPPYLILHLVRFTKNNFYLEKNHTIVTFPVKNLELKDYLEERSPLDESVMFELMSVPELKRSIRENIKLILDDDLQADLTQRAKFAIEKDFLVALAKY